MFNILRIITIISYIKLGYSDVIVQISNGLLRGDSEHGYYAFKGIPYAEPPLGENRFEIPKLYRQKWDEVRNFTKYSENCLQWNQFKQPNGDYLVGNEDCLYLNVFTSSIDSDSKLPVFVYFHGGAFMYGSGEYFGPKYLLENVRAVYVSLNYRLGPLGFLSTEDEIVPGNMGLKDQAIALQWIKDNIENFGGDPDNVVTVGLSAGGASVHLHYFSQLSKDLFSKGIAHSGCAINSWVLCENSLDKAKKLSEHIGCSTENNKIMIDCLKQKSAEEIVRGVPIVQPWRYNPFTPFGVTIEKPSENAFLTKHPIEQLISGNFSSAPLIFMFTEAEGLYPGADLLIGNNLPDLDENWNEYLPYILHYNDTVQSDYKDFVSQKIRQHYLNDDNLTINNFPQLYSIMSDRLFKYDIENAARLQSKQNRSNIYLCYYKFGESTKSIANYLSKSNIKFPAGHGDDHLIFLNNAMHINLTKTEIDMGKKFIKLYYEFAVNENPIFGNVKLMPIEINTNENENIIYLNIINNNNITLENSNDLGEWNFWKNLPFKENFYFLDVE